MSITTTIIIILGMLLTFILIAFGITCKKEVELKKCEYLEEDVDINKLVKEIEKLYKCGTMLETIIQENGDEIELDDLESNYDKEHTDWN